MKKIIWLIPTFAVLFGCTNSNQNQIEESGTIEVETAVISSKVTGEVMQIIKDEGAFIKTGDTLAIIDNEALGIQLKQANARKKMAHAALALLLKGSRNEDKEQAFEHLNQAQANYNQIEKDLERYKKLLSGNTITQKQFDDANTRFVVARAQLSAAQANYQKIQNIARKEEILQAEANLELADAQIELLEIQIRDSYIIAKKDGQVAACFIEPGELVTPKSALYKIADIQSAELKIYVSEEDLGKVKLGQQVDVSTDSYKDKTYKGEIIFISPEAEFTPKNIQTRDERTRLVFAVKVKIPNPEFELKTGMPADAVINL
jgi:HlyD family secretion protein